MRGTSYAETAIKEGRMLPVHSVYRRTVNLAADGFLLAVHPEEIPLTPLSVAVPFDDRAFAGFAGAARRAGGVLLTAEGTVRADGREWQAGPWEGWDPKIRSRLSGKQLQRLGAETEKFLTEKGREKGGLSDAAVFPEPRESDDLMTAVLRERVREVLGCGFSDPAGLKEILVSMTGLGPGLTPSGDDFLTGILLIIHTGLPRILEERGRELAEGVREASAGTNDISRQYLLCAIRGEYGMGLHELVNACLTQEESSLACPENRGNGQPGQKEKIRRALEKTAAAGHSSGIDTLNGILAGIRLILEYEPCSPGK